MSFAEQMKEHDDQFEKDKASSGTLPDGKYNDAVVTEARIEHNDSTDQYSMVMRFEANYSIMTQSGESDVHGSIRKWYNLDHEVGRSICAQDMARFGYEGLLSGLEEACEKEFFIGFHCEIKVVTKPGDDRDFVNVYVNRVLGKGPVPKSNGVPEDDDDIPF